MRLLCVGNRYPPWSAGGYEVIFSAAVRAFRAAGHPTRVLTTGPDPSDLVVGPSPESDVHRDLRWYWRDHRFPDLSVREALALEQENRRTLRRHLQDFSPHAVVWWAMGGMSLSLIEQVRRLGVPAVGVVGDEWFVYGPEVDGWSRRWRGIGRAAAPAVQRLTGVPTRLRLDRTARWVFISTHLQRLAAERGWRTQDSAVAHPGVDGSHFAPAVPKPWRWRLLYCGRVDPRKGILTAIQALAQLPPEARLTIDGPGEEGLRRELMAGATEAGVQERISFCRSASEQVPAAYADADAVIFPVTWREPWGLVPLEAMSVGRPVVASRAGGGPAEYLREEGNCLQFPAGDPRALAESVQRLAGDPGLRERLVREGRRTAQQLSQQAFHRALELELLKLPAGTATDA
ncbi:MAG: glycosyltransferase family 4 protein [Actinomycetota bacterium]|nr:glycosyltransferase family 4 protein [Actinomycetota bacterium]